MENQEQLRVKKDKEEQPLKHSAVLQEPLIRSETLQQQDDSFFKNLQYQRNHSFIGLQRPTTYPADMSQQLEEILETQPSQIIPKEVMIQQQEVADLENVLKQHLAKQVQHF